MIWTDREQVGKTLTGIYKRGLLSKDSQGNIEIQHEEFNDPKGHLVKFKLDLIQTILT